MKVLALKLYSNWVYIFNYNIVTPYLAKGPRITSQTFLVNTIFMKQTTLSS